MRTILLIVVALALVVAAQAEVNVPLQKLTIASTSGFTATAKASADGVAVTFKKTGDERRFLAVQGVPAACAAGARTAELTYKLDLSSGNAPRAAVLVYEQGGGSWYKVGANAVPTGAASVRVSVAALQQTAFSNDANKQVDWDQVESVWAGFVFDGPAEGQLAVSAVRLGDQTLIPTQPLRLTGKGQGKWSAGQDPAVKSSLEMVPGAPGGGECLKYVFTVPAGRHMYAIPSTPVAVEDLEGYSALRFKYKVVIPQGMKLLVTLGQSDGPAYCVESTGPFGADWAEMTIPLSKFQWANWSAKDEDGKFDLAKLNNVQIGSHGGAVQAGEGSIMVCDLELVP